MTDTALAVDYARRANDNLAETVRGTRRFGGFATWPQDPAAAAAGWSARSPNWDWSGR